MLMLSDGLLPRGHFQAGDGEHCPCSWQRQIGGVDDNLVSVHFVDALTGWTVGWKGTIVATRDGGDHWRVYKDSGDLLKKAEEGAQRQRDAIAFHSFIEAG